MSSTLETLRQTPAPENDAALRSANRSRQDITQELNRLMHDGLHQVESPVERAMALMGDKYSFQIIYLLYRWERMRFIEIEAQITGISPRTLSARLKHLDKYGLILRHQYATIPPKVEYILTDKGRDLADVLVALEAWTNRWFPYIPR